MSLVYYSVFKRSIYGLMPIFTKTKPSTQIWINLYMNNKKSEKIHQKGKKE